MKVLIVGMGSAGQRHMRNLKRILGNNIEFIAYRVRKLSRTFDDNLKVVDGQNVVEVYHVTEYYNLEEALMEKPDFAVIANPNSMHMFCAIKAAEKGLDLFIEKPLSVSLEGTDRLLKSIEEKNIICQVGFQFRYHPCIQLTKKYLQENILGKIISVNIEIGERISRMHPYEDYRDMQDSSRKLGGGVVLCQSHEIDYLYWLFGKPDSVYSIGGKKSEFDMDVEDIATTLFKYQKDEEVFPVVLHQDSIQYPPVRVCKIIGTKGRLIFDLLGCSFTHWDYESQNVVEKRFEDFKRNDMFMAEMQEFLACINERRVPECDAKAAIISTEVGLAIKKSFDNGQAVKL